MRNKPIEVISYKKPLMTIGAAVPLLYLLPALIAGLMFNFMQTRGLSFVISLLATLSSGVLTTYLIIPHPKAGKQRIYIVLLKILLRDRKTYEAIDYEAVSYAYNLEKERESWRKFTNYHWNIMENQVSLITGQPLVEKKTGVKKKRKN